MNFFEQQRIEAIAKLDALLALPSIPEKGEMFSDGECFVPWDLLPSLYGTYSSEFDDLALDVLTDIRDRTFLRTDLAAQMFRELLCTAGFCEYGTSPRVCFASSGFAERLPRLIERWDEYSSIRWKS